MSVSLVHVQRGPILPDYYKNKAILILLLKLADKYLQCEDLH